MFIGYLFSSLYFLMVEFARNSTGRTLQKRLGSPNFTSVSRKIHDGRSYGERSCQAWDRIQR